MLSLKRRPKQRSCISPPAGDSTAMRISTFGLQVQCSLKEVCKVARSHEYLQRNMSLWMTMRRVQHINKSGPGLHYIRGRACLWCRFTQFPTHLSLRIFPLILESCFPKEKPPCLSLCIISPSTPFAHQNQLPFSFTLAPKTLLSANNVVVE